ncbi:hypothetical protein K0M31_018585 [Melipona bicolor]|uniref:Uncharacterized protein n=1 Tax=Melipona bicolor TaxID=60889 RepID=A0AA40G4B8_9HYME|nr:hypothetical protein K0M31_018585 [Melipona bicolor]
MRGTKSRGQKRGTVETVADRRKKRVEMTLLQVARVWNRRVGLGAIELAFSPRGDARCIVTRGALGELCAPPPDSPPHVSLVCPTERLTMGPCTGQNEGEAQWFWLLFITRRLSGEMAPALASKSSCRLLTLSTNSWRPGV